MYKHEDRLYSIRGAIQIEEDSASLICEGVQRLYAQLLEVNGITEENIVTIFFSITDDLHAKNPASALRAGREHFSVPLFCMQEPTIDHMLPRTIRILIQCYAPLHTHITHLYVDGAASLRPDLLS